MRPARERFGPYGKARATSMSFATCEERATPPDGPKRSRPSGCVAFGAGLRCSLGQYRKIQPLRSRLGQHQNRQQRGVHEYFNRLLSGGLRSGFSETVERSYCSRRNSARGPEGAEGEHQGS